MEKRLKSRQYYADLYDKYTVEYCRRMEELHKNDECLDGLSEKELVDKKVMGAMKETISKMAMHMRVGTRYLDKEKIIQEWIERDQKADDFYENIQPPEDIRCLTCRNRLKVISKDYWTESGKSDRILFMYDCPNKCLPRRAFFSDGEEYRTKVDTCIKCDTPVEIKMKDDGTKLVTTTTCPKCGYSEVDELVWTHKEEDEIDLNYVKDRDRFCLSKEDGEVFREERMNIEQLGKIAKEWDEIQKARDEKLKLNPKGFHLEGAGYTCAICRNSTPEGDNWYDQYGIKCLICQKAIDEGEIPPTLSQDRDSWYLDFEIESYFKVKKPTLRKWVRDGIIKARTVSFYGKGVHESLYLIEDNKDFLPPKKIVESVSVTEKKDGKTWSSSSPWYNFVDPKEHLKDYKIHNYLNFIKNTEG